MSVRQDPAACPIEVCVGEVSLLADAGQRLIDLCDANVTSLQFGCRAGSCGTCLVRVVEGMANLSGITDNEKILLPELSDDPAARLGCQLRLFGPVRLVPMPPFAV